MGYPVGRSNTDVPLIFTLVLSVDHITSATGKSPTVTISKNGGAYVTPAGAITEIGNGDYQVAANAFDANTLGPISLYATASGCDPTNETFIVVNYNPTAFTPTTVSTPGAYTGRSIVNGAARELGVLGQGQRLSAENAATMIDILSRIVDDWNAEREAVYATDFMTFTFTPNLNPHTIGPASATWAVTSRPVKIEAATVVLSSGPNGVNAPNIRMHDQNAGIPSWFQSLSTPNIETSYPTDGYYDPTWPNGSFYLWPVPSTAYDCQIQVRAILPTYALNTVFSMPPGYRSALTMTLAEQCVDIFGRPMPQTLPSRALASRARIFANNTGGRQIRTQDAGMPTARHGRRSNFNWITGLTNTGKL